MKRLSLFLSLSLSLSQRTLITVPLTVYFLISHRVIEFIFTLLIYVLIVVYSIEFYYVTEVTVAVDCIKHCIIYCGC
jgi:hypothetical protein